MISDAIIDSWPPAEVFDIGEEHASWETLPSWRPHVFTGRWQYAPAIEHRQLVDRDSFSEHFRLIVRRLRESLETVVSPIARAFAVRVYEIEGVQAIYARAGGDDALHLWTAIDKDDSSLRDKVYDIEADVYELFPHARIDFHVLALEHMTGKGLPTGFELISRDVIGHATGPGIRRTRRAQRTALGDTVLRS